MQHRPLFDGEADLRLDGWVVKPGNGLGFYSDGARHVAAVVVSARGRRLFLEYDDDTIHTNVLQYLPG